ncbi:ATP-dependent DNA ligase, partial [Rathayibacter toxicus]
MPPDAVVLTVPGPFGERQVRLSSPERVLFPDLGITKRELAEYLINVGGAFVFANGGRALSVPRF